MIQWFYPKDKVKAPYVAVITRAGGVVQKYERDTIDDVAYSVEIPPGYVAATIWGNINKVPTLVGMVV
jgi:hypothetical protein